jgi:hypothetical protein
VTMVTEGGWAAGAFAAGDFFSLADVCFPFWAEALLVGAVAATVWSDILLSFLLVGMEEGGCEMEVGFQREVCDDVMEERDVERRLI